ncbi:MAG: oxygen-independent coproporphyrinogen III oxidase [Bacillaceae bacterium]|nr:MAG: oxygen-independent coproporphyrinogen III oxidase [Bacillaceae bacterium]
MAEAAYIHIPFCEQICHYCDFNKFFLQNQPVDDYLQAMRLEMKKAMEDQVLNEELKTIFIGGGTPTSLSAKQLDHLMESIHQTLPMQSVVEFTVECNPDQLTMEKLSVLKNAGVNRLSIGVQAFQDSLLKKIGRTHNKETVFQAVERARSLGFENISIDLMYGLPGQMIEEWKETLSVAFSLEVQHMSAYSLIVEPKTVFYNLMRKGKLLLPSQEEEAFMYETVMNEMERHGYHQYELSNFARKGFESKHNLTYWHNNHYYGFGAGAHSYLDGIRRENARPLKKYIEMIYKNNGTAFVSENMLTKEEMMEEEMFLGLRTIRGVSKKRFRDKYGLDVGEVFGPQIEEQLRKGLLSESASHLFLTKKGMLLGNEVFQAFLAVS